MEEIFCEKCLNSVTIIGSEKADIDLCFSHIYCDECDLTRVIEISCDDVLWQDSLDLIDYSDI